MKMFPLFLIVGTLAATNLFGVEPVNDAAIERQLSERGEEEVAAGRATKGETLISQLKRARCEIAPASAASAPLTAAETAKRNRAAVAVVAGLYKCDKCDRRHTTNASGFFISSDGVLVTCYHVIADEKKDGFVVMTGDGRIAPIIEVLAADKARDIAVVRVAGSAFAAVPVAAEVEVGSPVLCLSHPAGRYFVLTQGIASRYYVDPRRVEWLSITADFARGSSGAPIFDSRGNVIGMVANTESIYYDTKNGKRDNLQMVFKNCVTGKAILSLLKPSGA